MQVSGKEKILSINSFGKIPQLWEKNSTFKASLYMKNYIIFEWFKIHLLKSFRMAVAVQCNVWFLTGYQTFNFLSMMTILWMWRRLTFSEDIQTRAFEESWLLQLTGQGFERSEKQTKVNWQSVRNWWIWGKDAACLLCHTSNSLEIWKKMILSWKKSFLSLTIEQFTKEKRKKLCMCTFEMFDYMNKK